MKEPELDLQIDQNRLDEEWLRQPRLYFQYAEKAADARRRLDEARNELEVVKAELYQTITEEPAKFKLAKTTEASVTAAISIQPEYQKAQATVNQARYDQGIYDAAVTALDHRRKALENLVQLFLSNYFSQPRAPKGEEESIDRMEKQSVRQRGRQR